MRVLRHLAIPGRTLSAFLACAALLCAARLDAAIITVSSATAGPGQSAQVCVSLSRASDQMSGLQMDLNWDPSCMSADPGIGNAASCKSLVSGKNVHTAISPNSSMLRALVFSITNQGPIPDSTLFCCNFTLAASPSSSCCSIAVTNLRGSTAGGTAITDISTASAGSAGAGQICMTSQPGGSGSRTDLSSGTNLNVPQVVTNEPAGSGTGGGAVQAPPQGSSSQTTGGSGTGQPAAQPPGAAPAPVVPLGAVPAGVAGAVGAGQAAPPERQAEAVGETTTTEPGVAAGAAKEGQTPLAGASPRVVVKTPTRVARTAAVHTPTPAAPPTPAAQSTAAGAMPTETPKLHHTTGTQTPAAPTPH